MNWSSEELLETMKANPDLAKANHQGMPAMPPRTGKGQALASNEYHSTPEMTEADFQTRLIKELKANGWMVHAERTSYSKSGKYATPIMGDSGFPDIVAVKPPRLLILELKSRNGKLSGEQEKWILALGKCYQVETQVVRPEDYEEVLKLVKEQ